MARKPSGKTYSSKRIRPLFIILGVIALVILSTSLWFRYEDYLLAKPVMDINIPSDWRLIDASFGGNRLCLDACPSYGETYEAKVDGSYQLSSQFETWVKDAGFTITDINKDCSKISSLNSFCFVSGKKDNRYLGASLYRNQGSVIDNPSPDKNLYISIFTNKKSYLFGIFGR